MMDGTEYRKRLVVALGTDHAYLLVNREPTPEVVCALVESLALCIEVLTDRLRAADRTVVGLEERIVRMEQNALSDRQMRIMERATPPVS
jgi:hypothetical protein